MQSAQLWLGFPTPTTVLLPRRLPLLELMNPHGRATPPLPQLRWLRRTTLPGASACTCCCTTSPTSATSRTSCSRCFGIKSILSVGKGKQQGQGLQGAYGGDNGYSAALEVKYFHRHLAEAVQSLSDGAGEETAHGAADDEPAPTAAAAAAVPIEDKTAVVVGIEIMPNAVNCGDLHAHLVRHFPKCRDVAFLPGNEGSGLTDQEKESCDVYVKVPQYAVVGMADVEGGAGEDGGEHGGVGSMNVNTALAVVLQHFNAENERAAAQ